MRYYTEEELKQYDKENRRQEKIAIEKAITEGGGERIVIDNWQKEYNSDSFVSLAHLQRYKWVSRYLKGLNCLDDGCGSGYGTHYLSQNGVSSIVGTDISNNAIKFANKYYKEENLKFKQIDSLTLKFDDNSFDAVISFDVLEHIEEKNQSKFIQEIARVLKGTLYIGCPNATVSQNDGGNIFHKKELTRKEFELLLRESFEKVKIFGQDIVLNGVRKRDTWYKYFPNFSLKNLVIVDKDYDLSYGLLAVCKNI